MSSYNETVWTDSPESEITAEKLNNQETGIKQAHDGDNIPIFNSYDVVDQDITLDTEWEDVQELWSGEPMKSILMKISLFFKNMRFLYKTLRPQFAYLSLSSIAYISSAGGKIPFDSSVVEGTAFSVDGGVVTIEEDMRFVRITATIGGKTSSDAGNRCWLGIQRNGSKVCDAIAYGEYVSPSCYTIARAQKGDKFSVYAQQYFEAKNGGVGCYFQIEKIC